MGKQDITLGRLLADRNTLEARGFLIPNSYFDEPVRELVQLNLQRVQIDIPLEESVEILILAKEGDIQAVLMYDKVVKELATTAGGRPLVWDDKAQVFRLDGVRYSGRYGGLVREELKLDRAESQAIASFLKRNNIKFKYPDHLPDYTRTGIEGILHSFIRQYSSN